MDTSEALAGTEENEMKKRHPALEASEDQPAEETTQVVEETQTPLNVASQPRTLTIEAATYRCHTPSNCFL